MKSNINAQADTAAGSTIQYHVTVEAVDDEGTVLALGAVVVPGVSAESANERAKSALWHHGLDITYHRPRYTTVPLGCETPIEPSNVDGPTPGAIGFYEPDLSGPHSPYVVLEVNATSMTVFELCSRCVVRFGLDQWASWSQMLASTHEVAVGPRHAPGGPCAEDRNRLLRDRFTKMQHALEAQATLPDLLAQAHRELSAQGEEKPLARKMETPTGNLFALAVNCDTAVRALVLEAIHYRDTGRGVDFLNSAIARVRAALVARSQFPWLDPRLPHALAVEVTNGRSEETLDEAVRQACAKEAERISNEGAEAQVRFLLACGSSVGSIRRAAGCEDAPLVPVAITSSPDVEAAREAYLASCEGVGCSPLPYEQWLGAHNNDLL